MTTITEHNLQWEVDMLRKTQLQRDAEAFNVRREKDAKIVELQQTIQRLEGELAQAQALAVKTYKEFHVATFGSGLNGSVAAIFASQVLQTTPRPDLMSNRPPRSTNIYPTTQHSMAMTHLTHSANADCRWTTGCTRNARIASESGNSRTTWRRRCMAS